ncbi:hypothetical protein [Bacteroides sp.]
MSEEKMNSYRLTSMEEPTDEMLAMLMKEVAEEAKRKATEATESFFKRLDETVALRKKEWKQRINRTLSNE